MLYSQETVYAMRIIDALQDGRQRSLNEICEIQSIPVSWGYKIAKKLQNKGYISVRRGRYGGYKLDMELKKYTFKDFIMSVEPNIQIGPCVNRGCPLKKEKKSCAIYHEVMRLQRKMFEHLDEKTMYEVLNFSDVV